MTLLLLFFKNGLGVLKNKKKNKKKKRRKVGYFAIRDHKGYIFD